MKIGVASSAVKDSTEVFASVDLLDEGNHANQNTSAMTRQSPSNPYFDEDLSEDSSSNSDSDSESDSSDSSDSTRSSQVPSDSDDSSDSDVSETSSEDEDVNASAVTTRTGNMKGKLMNKFRKNPGNERGKMMKVESSKPPASTFKHKLKLPQLVNKGAKHQRLAADEDEADRHDKAVEFVAQSSAARNVRMGRDRKPLVQSENESTRAPFRVHDPANFPLEDYTDAEYGISGTPPETYSYASSNPMSIDYNPRSLKKMEALDSRAEHEKMQRKVIICGFCTTIMISMFIMIASVVSYENHIDVNPAPKNLDGVCSMLNIRTEKGHKFCEKKCKEAKCCMQSFDSSCFLEQEDVCTEYSPCGTIHTNFDANTKDHLLLVAPAPKNIGALCSDANIATQDGFLDCQAACNPGLCCLPTTVSKDDSSAPERKLCSLSHADVCEHYSPCKALDGVSKNYGSPLELVNIKCTPHNLKFSEGIEDCGNICKTRSCCFTDSKKANCREDNEVWCNEFAACEQLPSLSTYVDGSSSASTEFLEESSSNTGTVTVDSCKNMISLNNKYKNACTTICHEASCCFSDTDECEGHIDCEYYEKFCPKVFEYNNNIPNIGGNGGMNDSKNPSPVEVANACHSLATISQKEQCEDKCANFRCCFQNNYDPISCHSKSICDQYSICEELENDDGVTEFDVAEMCSINNLLTGNGYSQCENICEGKMCCFGTDGGCTQVGGKSCSVFEACEILVSDMLLGQNNDGSADFNVMKVCAKDSLGDMENKKICQAVCAGKSCCADNSCNNSKDCENYLFCSNLDAQIVTYEKPKVNLKAVCSLQMLSDSFYRSNCGNLCEPAKCCKENTCRHIADFCEHYGPCYNVWDAIGQ